MNTCKMRLHRFPEDMTDFSIAKFCDGVRIYGRIGKWHGIDFACLSNLSETADYAIALFEHNTYGDEAGLILAFYDRYTNQWVELCETWDGIEQALTDEDII